jgi:hypothetical protein
MRTLITINYQTFSLPAKDGLALLELLEKARPEDGNYIRGVGQIYHPGKPMQFSAEVLPEDRFVSTAVFEELKLEAARREAEEE